MELFLKHIWKKILYGGRSELFASGYGSNHFNDETVISQNTYQWDHVTHDGDFFKSGYGGQGLYISPSLDLVIAFFGTYRGASGSNQLPKISRQLVRSGLFKKVTSTNQTSSSEDLIKKVTKKK